MTISLPGDPRLSHRYVCYGTSGFGDQTFGQRRHSFL
jgi:hypothetical protein